MSKRKRLVDWLPSQRRRRLAQRERTQPPSPAPPPHQDSAVPVLSGQALAAMEHRGSHVQIIASAGSGKTEVVSQRVASLLAEGVPPEGIVAFTFTERAADELKDRIARRVRARLGQSAVDRLNGLYVGTIHAYCFRLLQQRVPRYETFDVLDENQLTAFLSREANRLGLKVLDDNNRLFASINIFLKNVDVVENELLDPAAMPDPFGTILRDYYATLERYRLLTYGQQVVRAVRELERPELAAEIHRSLRHLIVDEYQDVNPAQERLIQLLAGPGVEVTVVGDDQQAIYQWRGADVYNIMTFADRYPNVARFEIATNRRSRAQIVEVANQVGSTIPERLDKQMRPHRPSTGERPEVVVWAAETEEDEAGWIAGHIDALVNAGAQYRDIAVLVRSRAAYARLTEQFATFGIPAQPGGRTGLFEQPEARALGHVFAWLVDIQWRDAYGPGQTITDDALVDELVSVFGLNGRQQAAVGRLLREWKRAVPRNERRADLVGELYELLGELGVRDWDLTDPVQVNRLGTLARFSALLADYESVRRRARHDEESPGELVGGQDRGHWYYMNLALHIVNYAQGAYEGFDGEADFGLNAVDLTTIHRAKGLEWPAVFVPSLTAGRFPSRYTGRPQQWLVPRTTFRPERYEGSDADERRLFYVAVTRARDWLSVSRHEKVTTRRVGASPYYEELAAYEVPPDQVEPGGITSTSEPGDQPITMTYSQLASFMDCAAAFRLREMIGFQPRLATELGYGKAVHHVLRAVAEATMQLGRVPSSAEIDQIIDQGFFLPTANKVQHQQMRQAARGLVDRYVTEYESDLHRVWMTERPFELHLDGITVTGRADVILDQEGGTLTALAIVDYKTSTTRDGAHDLQLQIYADAGRREGLDVRAAYVHDLKDSTRHAVGVDPGAISEAEQRVADAAARIKARDFAPNPGRRCGACEVRTICRYAKIR